MGSLLAGVAARLGWADQAVTVVVVGGGVVGLTTALTLLERSPGLQVNPVKRPLYIAVHSIQVVVLADGWNDDTTSSVAAGIFLWGPPGPDPDTELEWARHSWNWYQAGLHTVVLYYYFNPLISVPSCRQHCLTQLCRACCPGPRRRAYRGCRATSGPGTGGPGRSGPSWPSSAPSTGLPRSGSCCWLSLLALTLLAHTFTPYRSLYKHTFLLL